MGILTRELSCSNPSSSEPHRTWNSPNLVLQHHFHFHFVRTVQSLQHGHNRITDRTTRETNGTGVRCVRLFVNLLACFCCLFALEINYLPVSLFACVLLFLLHKRNIASHTDLYVLHLLLIFMLALQNRSVDIFTDINTYLALVLNPRANTNQAPTAAQVTYTWITLV